MVANTNYGTDDGPGNPTSEANGFTPVANGHDVTNDEESPLLPQPGSPEPKKKALVGVGTIIAVLLLGLLTSFGFLVDMHD
jgi:hypothetical protein